MFSVDGNKTDGSVNESIKNEDKLDGLDKDGGSLVGDDGDKGDDFIEGDRIVREQDRRYANNARERFVDFGSQIRFRAAAILNLIIWQTLFCCLKTFLNHVANKNHFSLFEGDMATIKHRRFANNARER